MKDKILVTGATGTVGSLLVRELSKRGALVRAAARSAQRASFLEAPGVEIAGMDFKDTASVEKALDGIEKVYLLTPFVPEQVEMANTLIDYAKRSGVKLIVRQSALLGDRGITVERQHKEVENHLMDSGVPFIVLRPNFFMQNFVNYFGEPIRTDGLILLPFGEGKVSYIDARDIAAAAAAALTGAVRQGKIYPLTGPEALSLNDVARIFSDALGRKITYIDVPEEKMLESLRAAGLPEWNVISLMELFGVAKGGVAAPVSASFKELTGLTATAFEQFARDYAHALRERKAA